METQNLSFHGNRGAPHPQRGPRRNGAGASPTRRVPQDGHVRRLGPGAPTQARATHWGCVSRWLPALPAPGRALRSAGAVASGLRLNSSPRPEEARGGPTLPQRLVTLGGAGDGTAGRGRGGEPSGGRGNCSREDFHRGEVRSEKGKTPPARGEGRKAGLGQEEKTRRERSREMYELS